MATSTDIKNRANALSQKTDSNSITPEEVGGLFYDTADLCEAAIRNGGTLGIRKVYASISAMEADSTAPIDLWGNPMRRGSLCVIYDGTTTGTDNNKVFAFTDPGWQIAAQLDAAYATREMVESVTGLDDYPVFSVTKAYSAGDVVNYNGKLYKFTADHAAGAWTGNDVENTNIIEIAIPHNSDLSAYVFDIDGFIQSATSTFTSGFAISTNDGKSYANEDYSISEYIDIPNNSIQVLISCVCLNKESSIGLGFFDSSKIFLSGYKLPIDMTHENVINKIALVDVPKNAIYLRTTIVKGNEEDFVCSFYSTNRISGKIFDIETDMSETKVIFPALNASYGINANESSPNFGNGVSSSILGCTDYIECNGLESIEIVMPVLISEVNFGLVFYDSKQTAIKGYLATTGSDEYSIETKDIQVPSDANYFRTTFFTGGEYERLKCILRKNTVYSLTKKLNNIYTDNSQPLYSSVDFVENVTIVSNPDNENYGNTVSNSEFCSSEYLIIPEDTVDIEISTYRSDNTSNSGIVIYDNEKNAIKGYRYQYRAKKETFVATIHNIPDNAAFIRTCIYKKDKEDFVYKIRIANNTGVVVSSNNRRSDFVLNAKDYGIKDGGNCKFILFAMLEDISQDMGCGVIYVPGGTYILEDQVFWKSNVRMVGDGAGVTVFKPKGSISAFISNDELENISFESFTVDGELQSSENYGAGFKAFYFKKVKNATFRDLDIKNIYSTGLGVDFFINGIIENVRCDNCGRGADLNETIAPGASGIGIGTGAYQRGNETLVISKCHCNNCKQYGIFVETQNSSDIPFGTIIMGCTAEHNRTGFGVSGADSVSFIGCSAYKNHHAGFAYDGGTMGGDSIGKRPKFISCIAAYNGIDIPDGYPEYSGQENGFGWYIASNYDGIEMVSCNSLGNLKSGIEITNGVKRINIDGGEISGNGENGININGEVNSFRISPLCIKDNTNSGIRINGSILNGFIINSIISGNDIGIEKTGSGNINNSVVKDNFIFGNTTRDSDIDL